MLSHPAILERVIDPMRGDLSSELARHILNLHFAQNDRDRCAELSAKAREGSLTDDERLELADYVNINDFLTIMKAKAEASLRKNQPAA